MNLNPHGIRPTTLSIALFATPLVEIAQTILLWMPKRAVFGSTLLCFLLIQSATLVLPAEIISPTVPDILAPPIPFFCNLDIIDTGLTDNGWTKAFEENFNTLDRSIWDIWEGGAYNDELQCYQDVIQNLQVVHGVLEITAKKEAVTCDTSPGDAAPKAFDYTSGRIESLDRFTADPATPTVRIYARIKLSAGYGMWSAFWTYGDDWPTNGEIDILEARGQDHRKYETNYFYGSTVGINEVTGASRSIQTGVDLTDCYHLYSVEWTETELKFFIDGVLVDTKTSSTPSGSHIPDLFTRSQRITLNLAVGGAFFDPATFDPALIKTGTLYIDWVKVFTK